MVMGNHIFAEYKVDIEMKIQILKFSLNFALVVVCISNVRIYTLDICTVRPVS